MNKKILFIAYFYPPLAGSGVYRPLKMVEYLINHGYCVDVLTIENINYHTIDKELLLQSKANHIHRAKSYDPLAILSKFKKKSPSNAKPLVLNEQNKRLINSFFPIDNKIGWLYPAYKKANELFKNNSYDLCFATIGPYTSALLASKIAQKHAIPYIVDYRDHWTLNSYKFDYNPLNRVLSKYYEKKIAKKAALISCIGDVMKHELCKTFIQNEEDKCFVCYNGYDEREFERINEEPESKKRIIRYLGTFNGNRTVKYFSTALFELIEEGYCFNNLCFEFYGNFDSETAQYLSISKEDSLIKILPQIPHQESINKICSAEVLLLFISSEDGQGVLTGKIFEYIRSKKMILPMIRQDGEANAILKKLGYQKSCSMEDIDTIKSYIKQINEKTFNNYPSKDIDISFYSRENQCNQLIREIDKLFLK